MLKHPDCKELVERIRQVACKQKVWIWDPDSYVIASHKELKALEDTLTYLKKPFAHAFIVALAVLGKEHQLG